MPALHPNSKSRRKSGSNGLDAFVQPATSASLPINRAEILRRTPRFFRTLLEGKPSSFLVGTKAAFAEIAALGWKTRDWSKCYMLSSMGAGTFVVSDGARAIGSVVKSKTTVDSFHRIDRWIPMIESVSR